MNRVVLNPKKLSKPPDPEALTLFYLSSDAVRVGGWPAHGGEREGGAQVRGGQRDRGRSLHHGRIRRPRLRPLLLRQERLVLRTLQQFYGTQN